MTLMIVEDNLNFRSYVKNLFKRKKHSFNFNLDSSQTYGNNVKQVDSNPLIYAIYSGDVNHDGTIDLNDVLQIFNDANSFSTGYIVTDLTGDNIVDLNDVLIAFNNSVNFVSIMKP